LDAYLQHGRRGFLLAWFSQRQSAGVCDGYLIAGTDASFAITSISVFVG